eukprot:COSAG04_NODE_1344_length_7145_cov_59.296764_2_plen_508_part_00
MADPPPPMIPATEPALEPLWRLSAPLPPSWALRAPRPPLERPKPDPDMPTMAAAKMEKIQREQLQRWADDQKTGQYERREEREREQQSICDRTQSAFRRRLEATSRRREVAKKETVELVKRGAAEKAARHEVMEEMAVAEMEDKRCRCDHVRGGDGPPPLPLQAAVDRQGSWASLPLPPDEAEEARLLAKLPPWLPAEVVADLSGDPASAAYVQAVRDYHSVPAVRAYHAVRRQHAHRERKLSSAAVAPSLSSARSTSRLRTPSPPAFRATFGTASTFAPRLACPPTSAVVALARSRLIDMASNSPRPGLEASHPGLAHSLAMVPQPVTISDTRSQVAGMRVVEPSTLGLQDGIDVLLAMDNQPQGQPAAGGEDSARARQPAKGAIAVASRPLRLHTQMLKPSERECDRDSGETVKQHNRFKASPTRVPKHQPATSGNRRKAKTVQPHTTRLSASRVVVSRGSSSARERRSSGRESILAPWTLDPPTGRDSFGVLVERPVVDLISLQ